MIAFPLIRLLAPVVGLHEYVWGRGPSVNRRGPMAAATFPAILTFSSNKAGHLEIEL